MDDFYCAGVELNLKGMPIHGTRKLTTLPFLSKNLSFLEMTFVLCNWNYAQFFSQFGDPITYAYL